MTIKERELLAFLRGYVREHGYGPSYDEMAAHLGYHSKCTIRLLLASLERHGYVRKFAGRARSVEVCAITSDNIARIIPVSELGDLFRSGCWIPMNSESAA